MCAMQAVRAAAEAQQIPSDTDLGSLPSRAAARASKAKPMGSNPVAPKKLPAASKPSKAKPVIIRKRVQPPADADVQQVGAASTISAAYSGWCTAIHSQDHISSACCCMAAPQACFKGASNLHLHYFLQDSLSITRKQRLHDTIQILSITQASQKVTIIVWISIQHAQMHWRPAEECQWCVVLFLV